MEMTEVVAWDAPGAGCSSDPPERFGIAGYADCLAGFIGRVALERPHVAGLSLGGALARHHCNAEAQRSFNDAVRGFLRRRHVVTRAGPPGT